MEEKKGMKKEQDELTGAIKTYIESTMGKVLKENKKVTDRLISNYNLVANNAIVDGLADIVHDMSITVYNTLISQGVNLTASIVLNAMEQARDRVFLEITSDVKAGRMKKDNKIVN